MTTKVTITNHGPADIKVYPVWPSSPSLGLAVDNFTILKPNATVESFVYSSQNLVIEEQS